VEVSKSIFKRQADFLEKNGKYLLQFTLKIVKNKINRFFSYSMV
jgi:DNA-directed RNA polymerase specialized sigma54-like protein